MRKFFIPLLFVILIGGFSGWRATHPRLTDAEQIAANLDAICKAAKNRTPRGIADFLAKDFQAGGMGKKEFQQSLAAGILQFRVVNLGVSGVKSTVNGDEATSSGQFLLSLKSEINSPPQNQSGRFALKWRKIDGEWKISRADVPNLGQLGN